MLHFITGKKGSGKTTYLHTQMGKLVKENDAGVIVVVPKQFTFETDTGILNILGAKDACKVEVLSFSRLADTIFKTCRGTKKPPLSEGANAVMMSLALESVKDRLHFFARHYNNISFAQKMLDEIKSFKQNAVTPLDLSLAAGRLSQGSLKEKALETALIYDTYNALVEQSFYDSSDMLTIVYEILLENEYFSGKTVAIDGFNRFSVQELKIIRLMMKQADDVYVTLCTDNAQSTDESSPFAVSNRTARKLKNEAAIAGAELGSTTHLTDINCGFNTYKSDCLYALEENLYKNDRTAFEADTDGIEIYASPTVKDECDFVAAKIKMLMRTKQYRCRDMAVVYRNEVPYEKEIRHSLKKFGVPIFEDKRQPVCNEPLIIAVRALLEILSGGFTTDNLMMYLKTGLSGIDEDEIAVAENYALMWNLKASAWKQPWKDNPDGFGKEMNEERLERLSSLNETREKIVLPLLDFCEKMKDADGMQSMTVLYSFLMENQINENLKAYAIRLEENGNFELATEQEQIWDILMSVIDQIACTLKNKKISHRRLKEIFELVISSQSLGKLPNGFDEVYICDCNRIATITPKVVFVVGACEGAFPKTYTGSGIFQENEKNKLRELIPDIGDGAKQAAMTERFMVYSSLCCAREKLFVTMPLTNTKGEMQNESEIFMQIKSIFPKIETLNTEFLSLEEKIEGEKAAFELMAKEWGTGGKKENALKKYFYENSEYSGKLKAIEGITERKDFAIESTETAKELFGKRMELSASKLEDYELCPFKYFCRHAIKAYPRQVAKLDPLIGGTLVHFVLEKLLGEHKNQNISEVPEAELKKRVGELLDIYIETNMGGKEGKSERFLYLYSRMKKILFTIVDRLIAEFSDSDFVPCDFELEIKKGKKVEPFRIELEDGFIEIHGFIDRVDKMETADKKYLRVVDYKTGQKSFSLSDVMSGINMQMLIYLVSLWRGGEDYYGKNIVPAGVMYLPARFVPYEVERSDDENARNTKRLEGGKPDGMVLDEGEVALGMNRSFNGFMAPFKVSKKGALSGKFISLAQLGTLAKKMDSIMAQMGNELHSGHIPAKPAFGVNHSTTCDFCDYQSVCMKSEGVKKRYIPSLSHGECLGMLESEGGESDDEKLD